MNTLRRLLQNINSALWIEFITADNRKVGFFKGDVKTIRERALLPGEDQPTTNIMVVTGDRTNAYQVKGSYREVCERLGRKEE